MTLTYDALDRLTSETFPAGKSQPVYWAYDLLNRVLMASNVSAGGPGIAYAYDALGRTTSASQNGQTLSYAYDAAGNRTALTFPDPAPNALTADYTYDSLNHVIEVQQNGATSGPGLLATYSYDGLGRRTGIARAGGAGLATTYAYDAISRLSSLQQALAGAAGTTFGLTYNAANQVVSRTDSSGAYTIAPAAAASTYGVNGLNQYATITGVEQTLAGGPSAALTYDPLGRISSETAAGTTSNFLYDGSFLAGEYAPGGAIVARYVPGPGADEPLTVYAGAGLSSPAWYAADQEGSIIATADASAAATAQYAYDPYGEPLTSAGAPDWGGARYRYTGQIETAAQTYFYKARMYDPTDGRFFQTDPARFQGGINLYAYAMNDPVNGWDPTGMLTCVDTTIVISDGTGGFYVPGNEFSASCSNGGGFGFSALGGVFGGGGSGGSQRGNSSSTPPMPPKDQPKPFNCATGVAVADALDKASKAAGAGALGIGVAGAGIEAGSLGSATLWL